MKFYLLMFAILNFVVLFISLGAWLGFGMGYEIGLSEGLDEEPRNKITLWFANNMHTIFSISLALIVGGLVVYLIYK